MAGIKIKVGSVDRGYAKLMRAARDLQNGAYIKVGVLDDGKGSEIREGGMSNAQLAGLHEFGSDDGHIPERPFMRTSLENHRAEYQQDFRTILKAFAEGRISLFKGLTIIGLKAAADMKKTVTAGPPIPPPNAPSTIARKRRGKAGIIRTLVDTGSMVGAIAHAVVMGKGLGD